MSAAFAPATSPFVYSAAKLQVTSPQHVPFAGQGSAAGRAMIDAARREASHVLPSHGGAASPPSLRVASEASLRAASATALPRASATDGEPSRRSLPPPCITP